MSKRAKRGRALTPADYVAELEFSGPGQRQLRAPREALAPQPLPPTTQAVLAPQPPCSHPSPVSASRSYRRPQTRKRLSASRTPEAQRRHSEASAFPARLLPALPAPLTLFCEACALGAAAVPFVVTTSRDDYAQARRLQLVTLHGAEWAAVALAAARGRVTALDFADWLARKQREPSWELTPASALGGYVSAHDEQALTVEAVLRACGAQLLNVTDAAVASGDVWQEITK